MGEDDSPAQKYRPHRRLAAWRASMISGSDSIKSGVSLGDTEIARILNKPSPRSRPGSCRSKDDPNLSRRSLDIFDPADLSPLSFDHFSAEYLACTVEKMNPSPRYGQKADSPMHDLVRHVHDILDPQMDGNLDRELDALVFGDYQIDPFSAAPVLPPAQQPSTANPPAAVQEPHNKQCRCLKSRCLKLYCECFAANVYCNGCKCKDCHNNEEHADSTRKQAMFQKLDKRPEAFAGKVTQAAAPEGGARQQHIRGCNCKRSGCRKKYCECYQNGVLCGANCNCKSCKNQDHEAQTAQNSTELPDIDGCFQFAQWSTPPPVVGSVYGQMKTWSPRHFTLNQQQPPGHEALFAGLLGNGTQIQRTSIESDDQETPSNMITDEMLDQTPNKQQEAIPTDMFEDQQKGIVRSRNTPRSSAAAIRALVHDNMFAKTPTSGTIVKKRRVKNDPVSNVVSPEEAVRTQEDEALEMLAAFVQQC